MGSGDKAFKTCLHPRTRRAGAGALTATELATGAALIFANGGSSSPDADAKTAAMLDALATSAKTAPASRALKEIKDSRELHERSFDCGE